MSDEDIDFGELKKYFLNKKPYGYENRRGLDNLIKILGKQVLSKIIMEVRNKNGVWLDVGCGEGNLVKQLRSKGIMAYGLDILSRNMKKYFIRGFAELLPLKNYSIQVISDIWTFPYVRYPFLYLERICECLVKDGYLIVVGGPLIFTQKSYAEFKVWFEEKILKEYEKEKEIYKFLRRVDKKYLKILSCYTFIYEKNREIKFEKIIRSIGCFEIIYRTNAMYACFIAKKVKDSFDKKYLLSLRKNAKRLFVDSFVITILQNYCLE